MLECRDVQLDSSSPAPKHCQLQFRTYRLTQDGDGFYFVDSQTGSRHLLPNAAYSLQNHVGWKFPLVDLDVDSDEDVPIFPPPSPPVLAPGGTEEVDNTQILAAIRSMDARLQAMEEIDKMYT
ncbi:hypothetical protein E2542_SST13391 [Spatholobus suberectus]|nr:hypothetical protein E2542_SST13391 [Spatholobus suberectus]